jgi:CO dehydrogenase maturation factor
MSKIIAVAGKGGTGKTTIAALVIRALKEKKEGSILAIDADPNNNLGQALGAGAVSTIVEIIDDISQNPDQIPPGVTKDRFINLRVQESLNEEEGYDLLTMGRPEGPGCYCFANNMLRELITKLMKSYSYIVIDNEAGMEHLSRRLVRKIDSLFVVSDSSLVGVRSAARISQLTNELKITVKEKTLIINKSKGKEPLIEEETKNAGFKERINLPFTEEVEEAATEGKTVLQLNESNALLAAIKEKLLSSKVVTSK